MTPNADSGGTSTFSFTWKFDKPVPLDKVDEVTGVPGLQRMGEMMVVNEVISHVENLPRLRLLVARDLGYNDLADLIERELAEGTHHPDRPSPIARYGAET